MKPVGAGSPAPVGSAGALPIEDYAVIGDAALTAVEPGTAKLTVEAAPGPCRPAGVIQPERHGRRAGIRGWRPRTGL